MVTELEREADLRRMRDLHRLVLATLVKECLREHPDPELRTFAARLPDQVDSVEAHLKNFWDRQGYDREGVQDFARRYGHALGQCPAFQAFERGMEDLARSAGNPEFAGKLAALAAELGVTLD